MRPDTERKARYERIGKASAKTIKNMLAGTPLGEKLRAKALRGCRRRKSLRKRINDLLEIDWELP